MAVKKFDLIAIEFVIVGVELLNTPQSLGRFGSALREYRWTPISQAQNGFGDGRRVSLDRERIYLDLTATRSRVRQEYPAEDGFPDLAELVSRTIDLTDKPAGSVGPLGYNIEVSYEQDSERSAFSYIGQKVFAGLGTIQDWNLVGGMGAAVRFEDNHGVIRNVHIEPRFRNESFQRVYLHLNVHVNSNRVPTTAELAAGLSLALEDAKKFIYLLEGNT
jgi:hypothetical protein